MVVVFAARQTGMYLLPLPNTIGCVRSIRQLLTFRFDLIYLWNCSIKVANGQGCAGVYACDENGMTLMSGDSHKTNYCYIRITYFSFSRREFVRAIDWKWFRRMSRDAIHRLHRQCHRRARQRQASTTTAQFCRTTAVVRITKMSAAIMWANRSTANEDRGTSCQTRWAIFRYVSDGSMELQHAFGCWQTALYSIIISHHISTKAAFQSSWLLVSLSTAMNQFW